MSNNAKISIYQERYEDLIRKEEKLIIIESLLKHTATPMPTEVFDVITRDSGVKHE